MPQRKNAVARSYPEEFGDRDYIEICNFRYFYQHYEFARQELGMKKVLRNGVNVSVVIPVLKKTDTTVAVDDQVAA